MKDLVEGKTGVRATPINENGDMVDDFILEKS